ncbi:MAG TPA: hypothetical protein VGL48_01555 [Acidimicrobiales bacterium]
MPVPDAALKARQHPLVLRARHTARRSLDRIDNEPVRRARGLLKALKGSNPPDLLYLGDSMLSFVSPTDVDRRRLDTMVADGLGAEKSMHVVDGASFHVDIFEAYLRLLYGTSHRPLVIVPLWIRGRTAPFIEHPVHGHKKAIEKIRQVDPSRGAWRVRGMWPRPTPEKFEAFYEVPFPTVLGDLKVGDYVRPIAEFKRSGNEAERLKTLYAYHHGGLLLPDSPVMEGVTRMAATIRDLGCRVVVYQTPVPVETASALLGPELVTRTAASFAALDAAYRAGSGDDTEIVQSGMSFPESEFIDPTDASEHLNQHGRIRLAEMITDAVKRRQSSG